MKPSSNPPNSVPERSFSKVDLFLEGIRNKENGDELTAVLWQVAKSDPNDIGRMAQLRMLHGEEAIKLAYALHELSEELGCGYDALQRAILLKLDQATQESQPVVNMPGNPASLPAPDETGRWSVPPTSLSPEEITKGVTLEERAMLEALLTLDDISDIGAVMQLANKRRYKKEQVKTLLDLAGDLTRLPGNPDENRGRIMAALSEVVPMEDDRDSSQRETSEWRADFELTPERYVQMLTVEGQVMLGAYISLEDRKNEKQLEGLRKKYGADAMKDIISQVEDMMGVTGEEIVLQKFSELLTGRKTISFNPNDEDMNSQKTRTSEPKISKRPAMVMTPELDLPEAEETPNELGEEEPVSIPVDMTSIWNVIPYPEMGIQDLVDNLTPEGQDMLEELLNMEDIRDAMALGALERKRGKKGHVMLAFQVVDRLNKVQGGHERFNIALAARREHCIEFRVPVGQAEKIEAAPFSASVPAAEISSPWVTAPEQASQASEDPLGDFLSGLSENERLELERDLHGTGHPEQHYRQEWSGVGGLVLKKLANKEPGFKDPTLILARLQAMRIAEAANSSEYGQSAAFVSPHAQRSHSPWEQYATRQPSPVPEMNEEDSPLPPTPPARPILKSTNRFNNMAVAVPPHTLIGSRTKSQTKPRTAANAIELVDEVRSENEFIDKLSDTERAALSDYTALKDRNDTETVNQLTGRHGKLFWEMARAIDLLTERRKVSLDHMLTILSLRLDGGDITEDHFTPKIIVKNQQPEEPLSEEEIRQRHANTVISTSTKARKGESGGLFGRALFGKKGVK